MSKILKIRARQVFDSRGNPTIEAQVYSKNLSASAICPSGASTGTYEAFEKRDNNNKKYLGKSVLGAVNLVNTKISKKLIGANIHDQTRIDTILINLDGTRQKTSLGANAILAVSMAAKKLSAKIKNVPLYKTFLVKNNYKLPYPLMNIINGGAHANNGLRIQEFMIRPDKARSFSEAMRICFVVINNLRKLITKKGLSTSVGDEGGFTVFVMVSAMRMPSDAQRANGVACVSASDFRWEKAHIKSTSLLGAVFSRQISADAGALETVMFRGEHLSEAAASNVWVVKNGVVMGPPKDNLVLEGIRYGLIEQLCADAGIGFELRLITRDEVLAADELLLSSATKEVLPITLLDGQAVGNGVPGPIYQALYQRYQLAKTDSA